jgi:hypothetical protein
MESAKGATKINQLLVFYWNEEAKEKEWTRNMPALPLKKGAENAEDCDHFLEYNMGFLEWEYGVTIRDNDFLLFRQFLVPNGEEPKKGNGKLRGIPSSKLPVNAELPNDKIEV